MCRFRRAAVLLLFFSTWIIWTPAGSSGDTNCFSALVHPGGWKLPKVDGAQQEEPFNRSGFPSGVTSIRYLHADPMWLPRYYVEDGRLVLRQLRCRFENPVRLEIQGRSFAFLASALGLDVGSAGDVWWVDRDGDATFEELHPRAPSSRCALVVDRDSWWRR